MTYHHILGLLTALLLAISYVGPAQALPRFEQVRQQFRPSETLLLSREGELLQRLRTDSTVRRGQWVALADISPALQKALLLSEDRRLDRKSVV